MLIESLFLSFFTSPFPLPSLVCLSVALYPPVSSLYLFVFSSGKQLPRRKVDLDESDWCLHRIILVSASVQPRQKRATFTGAPFAYAQYACMTRAIRVSLSVPTPTRLVHAQYTRTICARSLLERVSSPSTPGRHINPDGLQGAEDSWHLMLNHAILAKQQFMLRPLPNPFSRNEKRIDAPRQKQRHTNHD